jgi:hypothetical protein
METAHDIIEAAGRNALKTALGVQDRVIQHHLSTGRLPASWFDLLERMTGQTLPRHVFSFKGVSNNPAGGGQ